MLAGSLFGAPVLLSFRATAADDREGELRNRIADLERRHGGRLGVAVLDTTTMKLFAYRGDERFPLCSTFKLLAAAFVLARVDSNRRASRGGWFTRRITWSPI